MIAGIEIGGGQAATHEVSNQPPPLQDYDLYGADTALREAVEREGGGWAHDRLHELGTLAGSADAIGWGFDADRHRPELRTHDRFGHRLDEVTFHPAYHRLLAVAVERGLHGSPWADPRPGAHVARAAGLMLWTQVDAGVSCPTSMTYAAVPVLRRQPELDGVWTAALTSHSYDPRPVPVARKSGALAGMAMTEKQGGSDVRAASTLAVPAGPGAAAGEYLLTGHKWFCSAPASDAFLVLARAPEGVTCFLLPRVLPDGSRNAVRLMRLKDKLGNRSNASAEIELDGALAWLLGAPGRGVATIVEMVALTRLDCVLGTAGLIRQGLAQAVHHAEHRRAFGARLADAPLMREVLADLAVESEAATLLGIRLAGAVDRCTRPGTAGPDDSESLLRRLGTAVAKFWVCKRGPAALAEALECLGGNGYVEESVLPRLYREAPVNSVWEGSGNVNALDVLRALARTPAGAEAFLAEVDLAAGGDSDLDAARGALRADLHALIAAGPDAVAGADVQRGARRLVERMATTLAASLLVRHSPAPVARAYCAGRLGPDRGGVFGTLPAGTDVEAVLSRTRPGSGAGTRPVSGGSTSAP